MGETFDAGAANGPRGKAKILALEPRMELEFTWGAPPEPLLPVMALIGLPRPQTARKILSEAAGLGLCAVWFFRSKKGESSYAASKLWSTDEWRRHLIQGAEQAFTTRLPEVRHFPDLAPAAGALEARQNRLALDVYEAAVALAHAPLPEKATCLAFGPERGWSAAERDVLRARGFTLAGLGPRVLRSETALAVALGVLAARQV